MPDTTHDCPGQCGRQVSRNRLACHGCWFRLPEPLRRAVTNAWANTRRHPGDRPAAAAHRFAVAEALTWYRQNTTPAGETAHERAAWMADDAKQERRADR